MNITYLYVLSLYGDNLSLKNTMNVSCTYGDNGMVGILFFDYIAHASLGDLVSYPRFNSCSCRTGLIYTLARINVMSRTVGCREARN